ncbi:MAG: ABC transporter ATP-binding protein/permease [Prevotella sp.]|nr:ABC transporter ATP-binding protein/permease [Staphylococcus sp.]MCM1350380.1 ABC transporter ATP-binding protein/permease [Prevotella sp.]
MLELNHITKIYTGKKEKNKIVALDDVHLSFSKTGLVFILGPSGCGKSTLLNILGGIDYPTSGSITIYGNNIPTSEKSLDDYRNQYIGFVFQDYNLISNITIYDNLSLACFNLSKDEKDRKITQVLQQVGLENYEKRFPTELSGGQMQRVAIARALLKDSQILLADEPTGNLNSEMSIEIMELLRTLSLEKLVIIVSHNESLATQYANRMIYIQDGKVVKDTLPSDVKEKNDTIQNNPSTKALSSRMIVKMMIHNLTKKKVDTVVSTFILLLSFIVMFISFSFVDYNRKDVDTKNIPQFDYLILQSIFSNGPTNHSIYESQLSEIEKKYPSLIAIKNNTIDTSQDILDYGMTFYPHYEEITDESIYISDFAIKNLLCDGDVFYDSEGKRPVLATNDIAYDALVGTYFRKKYGLDNFQFYRINGIYQCIDGYLDAYDSSQSPLKQDIVEYYNKMQSHIYYKKNGKYYKDFHTSRMNYFPNDEPFQLSMNGYSDLNTHSTIDIASAINWFTTNTYQYILTDQELIYIENGEEFVVQNDNEIYLTLPLYNLAFNEDRNMDYFVRSDFYIPNPIVEHYSSHINEEISIEIMDQYLEKHPFQKDKLIFKGILLDKNGLIEPEHLRCQMIVSETNYFEMIESLSLKKFQVKIDSVSNIRQFVKDANQLGIQIYYPYIRYINDFEYNMGMTQFVFTCLFMLLTILTLLQQYYFMKRMIKHTSKEIGILRSIGIRKKDILKIYLFQILFMTSTIIIITLIASYVAIQQINITFVESYSTDVFLLFYKWWYLPFTILLIGGIGFISSSFTLFQVMRRRTIDIIRKE